MKEKVLPTFYGEIEQGRLKMSNMPRFVKYIAGLKGKVQLVVKPVRKSRSLNQNAYYWGVHIRLIADYTGDDEVSVHEDLKAMFSPRKVSKLTGQARPISTSAMSKLEFGEYLEKIRVWAAQELSITIPDAKYVELN